MEELAARQDISSAPQASDFTDAGTTSIYTSTSFDLAVTATYNLTTVFTPPSSCLALTYTIDSQYGDSVQSGGAAVRSLRSQCFPSNYNDGRQTAVTVVVTATLPPETVSARDAAAGKRQATGSTTVEYKSTTVDLFGNTYTYAGAVPTTRQATTIIQTSIIEVTPTGVPVILATFFSPGTCPLGYATASAGYNGLVTFQTCCPSGMTIASGTSASDCTGPGGRVTIVSDSNTWWQTVQSRIDSSIVVAYQSSDLSLFTTATSSAEPSQTSTSSSGLSTGAQAGIGVGIALAVLLLSGIAIGFLLRRRRQVRQQSALEIEPDSTGKAELSGEGKERPELGDKGVVYEAGETSKPPEAASTVRAELEGDWAGWEMGQHTGRERS